MLSTLPAARHTLEERPSPQPLRLEAASHAALPSAVSQSRRYRGLAHPRLGGYLTDKDQLHFGRFEAFVRHLSRNEAAHFEMKAGNVARRPGQPIVNHKRKFYLEKLGMHPRDTAGLRRLVQAYLEGLCWCLHYYHQGYGSTSANKGAADGRLGWNWCT